MRFNGLDDWKFLFESGTDGRERLRGVLFFVGKRLDHECYRWILGNMQSESNINPGVWQNLDSGNYSLDLDWSNGRQPPITQTGPQQMGTASQTPEGQLRWIDEVTVSAGQWIPTSGIISASTHSNTVQSPRNTLPVHS